MLLIINILLKFTVLRLLQKAEHIIIVKENLRLLKAHRIQVTFVNSFDLFKSSHFHFSKADDMKKKIAILELRQKENGTEKEINHKFI